MSASFRPGIGEVVLRDASSGRWLRFREPEEVIEIHDLADVVPGLRRMEALVRGRGWWAAGFLAYEAAPAFDRALRVRSPGDFPLLWFGLYPRVEEVEAPRPEHDAWIALDWKISADRWEHAAAIARIKDRIARGDTYQVNHTVRLRAPFEGDAWDLFRALSADARAGCAAYVDAGRFAIASVSPELFFLRRGEEVLARPMKGTAPRGRFPAEDIARAEELRTSEKDRAENIMIVDMIRNDLGRVAETGSVSVPRLFEVERYPTVWQMTSTVTARCRAPLTDLLAATFPCASITGAPKPRTMEIIAELEDGPRRIYTGSIGLVTPSGDAQLNVAIRTVLVDREAGVAEYGVGGGIVWDSDPAAEYAECLEKARVLTERPARFDLLETILWEPGDGPFLLEHHLQRLSESADHFDFSIDIGRVRQRLQALGRTLPPRPHRVRLTCSRAGEIAAEAAPMEEDRTGRPLHLAIARDPVRSADRLLFHKTTCRRTYDEALAARPGADDVILWNERGEMTETTIGNIVARRAGRFITPPVECGLLPGTFRRWLIERGEIEEGILRVEDLRRCEALYRINSVRRWQEAVIVGGGG
jgi:para-aminobenzoate synthetase/4-amino-4-deoxychorismate lyase